MTNALERWAASGVVAFRLPSGLIVSGVWPSPSDLMRRGVVPWTLRNAVLQAAGKNLEDLTDDDVARNVEQRQRVAADFVRGLYDDETGEWESLRLAFDDLSSLPGEDIDALDIFVQLALGKSAEVAALEVNAMIEDMLGLVPAPVVPEEAGDTVDGWAEFRGEPAGGNGHGNGTGVADAPEHPAPGKRPMAGVSRRRRTGVTASP